MVNIVFGLIVYFLIVIISGNFYSNIVDTTINNYAAQNYGIISGDKIIKINNKKVGTKDEITKELNKYNGESITVTLIRNNQELSIEIMPTVIETKDIGIFFTANSNQTEPKISAISKNSPAELAGMKENDVIIEVDGKSVENNIYNVASFIQNSESNTITIAVKRQNELIYFNVVPNIVKSSYLGVIFKKAENTLNKLLKR